ncbi:HNH endonuclease [Micromonospora sp. NPDC049101]|uniref:NUMOD4 motif-containing HNH endonuclease n=1 Tax=Micromonospora sp. NPDC049101 TaxID=3155032 RepID=UPI0033DCD9DB
MEDWKPVGEFPNYDVSSHGRVRNSNTGRILRGARNPASGYVQFWPYSDGRAHARYAHVLVAAAFYGEKPAGFEVDHIDGDRENNRRSNLRYLTSRENRLQCGRRKRNPNVTEDERAEVLALVARGVPMTAIAAKLGRHWRTIHRVVKDARMRGALADAN